MKKRLLSSFLVLAMVLTMLPTAAFATEEAVTENEEELIVQEEILEDDTVDDTTGDTDEVDGTYIIDDDTTVLGTTSLVDQAEDGYVNPYLRSTDVCIGQDSSNPFYIGNTTVLAELAILVNANSTYGVYSYASAYYVMVADIDVSDMDWTPIGTDDNAFNGTFTGGAYTVTLSAEDYDTSATANGLFGTTGEDATISVTVVSAGGIDDTYASGDGSQESPYQISTADQLTYLATQVNAGTSYTDTYFKVTTDIDLNSEAWAPIGSSSNPFSGTFDGDGNTISNLSITGSNDYQGLFGYISDATIENVNVQGSVSGTSCIGGVVGLNYATSGQKGLVTNCSFTGSVNGDYNVGGIVGNNESPDGTVTVSYCTNNGTVTGTGNNVGGIVGFNTTDSNDTAIVTYCTNTGNVTGDINVGGIVGSSSTESGTVQVTNNVATCATVTGNTNVGRIVGFNYGTNATLSGNTASASMEIGTSGSEAVVTSDTGGDTIHGENIDESAISISTAAELAKIGTDGAYPFSGSYILTQDINLNNQAWTPIGNSTTNFTGTFDGGGYTISGLNVAGGTSDDSGTSNYQGLFGYVSGGTVKNLNVSGTVTGYQYVGGVVGENYNGTVDNCSFSGTVTGYRYVGGVVGNSYTSSVSSCYNTGDVNGSDYVGGVVGRSNCADENSSATVTNCYNTGAVTATSIVGGVVGYNFAQVKSTASVIVSNCYNTGTVSGPLNPSAAWWGITMEPMPSPP